MWTLDRLRYHLPWWQIEMLAPVTREVLLLEHLYHGVEGLASDFAPMLRSGVEPEPFHHIGRGAASGAEFAPAVGQHVQRRHTLSNHERVVARQQDHGETEPDGLRPLRRGCEEHLGTRAMADLSKEVLLSQPEVA